MNIQLCRITDDSKKVNKSIGVIADVSAIMKENTSMLQPTFLISRKSWVNTCNYIYVEDFDRYYFIGNPVYAMGGMIEIPCKVDVLTSNRDKIRAIRCTIERQEKVYNPYLPDSQIVTDSKRVVDTIGVGSLGSDDGSIILTVVN